MAFSIQTIFGDPNKKALKKYESIVAQTAAFESAISALSDEKLKAKTLEFKAKLAGKTWEEEQKILLEIMPEAFAVVREASKRVLGQRHFDVQLIGAHILHNNSIAEMRTGEGKTLVATLPAYLNALSGRGVHIVTVNDYLSRRDGAWMGVIYNFLGLSMGVVNHEASYLYDPLHQASKTTPEALDEARKEENQLGSFKVVHEFLRPVTRREAYAADITYGTNNEFGFDYLRDNLEYDALKMRQRGFQYPVDL